MGSAIGPSEIFDRAVEEGRRRLNQSLLELVATSFIAGFTIVFGIAALGIVRGVTEQSLGGVAHVAGSLAFGIGLVLLVVGRAELFTENFFDPVATAADSTDGWLLRPLLRLWVVTFALNLLGGGLLVWVLAVEGAMPAGTAGTLGTVAEEIAHRTVTTRLASAVAGGALVALLSHTLVAVESDGSRIAMSFAVGFLLALGPFDHVVVTVLHVFYGVLVGANVHPAGLVGVAAVATVGNVVGGLGLVTMTHIAQVHDS
jgi:formate/nitrite transporter FocA (FNT family)